MKTLFTAMFLFLGLTAAAQQYDWRKIGDTIRPPLCGWRDSLSLTEIIPKMRALDTNLLTMESRYYFFDDLAMEEYMFYGYMLDTNLLLSSRAHYKMALYHNPKCFTCCWNIALNYGRFNDCENKLYWLNRYEELIPRRFLRNRRDDLEYHRNKCK